jgi:hypothetical protein
VRLKRTLRPRRELLPSLYERYPEAGAAARHPRGLQTVPVEAIVGTARHPSQNTADFLPLPALRGRNWEARWLRIQSATTQLRVLPPIELLQVGDTYWVVDGHNRVAAARDVGAVAVDAEVTELRLPGTPITGHTPAGATALLGSDELRLAAEGRLSRTVDHRIEGETLGREQLGRMLQAADAEAAAAEEEAAADEVAAAADAEREAAEPSDEEPPGVPQ